MSLHTSPGCSLPPTAESSDRSTLVNTDCESDPDTDSGCGFLDTSDLSFGEAFNNGHGGVFAHHWNDTGIFIWHWPRDVIPADITAKNPTPSEWGPPVASFPATDCDIASHFSDHSLILDITLCGDWAGATYSTSQCPGTCADAVADPTNFQSEPAWMDINSH